MKTAAATQNYQASITVNTNAKETMKKIAKVNKWWTADFTGKAENLNDKFTIRFGSTFVDFQISELVPEKKVVWKVTDCYLHSFKDKKEWNNTEVVFNISETSDETKVDMEHVGLSPEVECFEECQKGWNFFIRQSLYNLLTTGSGLPDTPKALR